MCLAFGKTGLLALRSALIFSFILFDSRPVEPFFVAAMAPCCAELAIIIVAKPTETYLSYLFPDDKDLERPWMRNLEDLLV